MKHLVPTLPKQKQLWITCIITFLSFTSGYAQYDVIVAKDGSGNFATLQAAIDAAPANRTTPYKIFVKKGKYAEKVTIPATKTFLYVTGEGINETIISWDDYSGKPGVSEIATVTINANDCAFMNMTIENSWGRRYDGPQALALKANADRLIFKNCKLVSGQDTVMATGNGKRQYYRNCYIDGNTDYIYGSAIAVFDSCVLFNRDRLDGSSGSVFTAASTPAGQIYGYVFRDCLLPDNNGQTTYTLGRPWGNSELPHTSETKVVFLNCRMGKTVSPVRWQVWSAGTDTSLITYAEYKTKYFNGTLVDLSKRVGWSKEFTDAEAAPYFVNSNMFGTWDPCAVSAEACAPFNPVISLSNFRVNRSASSSTFRFNICWPVSGVTYELYRSTDSIHFSSVNSFTSSTDTTVAYQFTDALPASGTSYFYKIEAKKAGFSSYTTDTVLKVNIAVPLNGEFRSSGSGYFNNASTGTTANTISIWEKYDAATNTWIAQALGIRPVNVNVTIRTGHTVTLDALAGISSLTIENGATLNATGTATGMAQTLRIGSGPAPVAAVIQNDGMFGSVTGNNDGIILEPWISCSHLTITGSGTTSIARFRPSPGNTSGTPSALDVVIDQDMNFGYNNVAFTGYYNNSSNTTSEIVNITINAGKTVKLANALGQFHLGTGTTNQQGNITYNINGTLDLGLTNTSNMVPSSVSSGSSVTVNVNDGGLLKPGTSFGMTNSASAGSFGAARININDGGIVDATRTTTLQVSGAANSGLFVMKGTGMLKRLAANTVTTFPVGTGPSMYNPVTITNSGVADTFYVSLDTTFAYPVTDTSKVVRKQWSITESAAGGSNATLALSWVSADQATGFDPSQPVSIIHHNGSAWEQIAATVTGSGTPSSPYVATANGITSFSCFGVQNTQSVLPLHILSFTAQVNGPGKGVELKWTTTNEFNTKEFIVERRAVDDGYKAIGKVASTNSSGVNRYSFTDVQFVKGVNYYRLKQVDIDDAFTYSAVVYADVKKDIKISVFPNPATDKLILIYPAGHAAEVSITRMDGSIMYCSKLSSGSGNKEIILNKFARGSYVLMYQDKETSVSVPFIKR